MLATIFLLKNVFFVIQIVVVAIKVLLLMQQYIFRVNFLKLIRNLPVSILAANTFVITTTIQNKTSLTDILSKNGFKYQEQAYLESDPASIDLVNGEPLLCGDKVGLQSLGVLTTTNISY